MISKALKKARAFEVKNRPLALPQQPAFHVTGGTGWINDPNGFAPYRGEYHLFFQYHPYAVDCGPMHWGHMKTRDFIRWERLPAALAPDMDYDRDGCFSGGAVELEDGRHLLMYTGVRNRRREDGVVQAFQTQCIAVGDGVDYEKLDGNPVIDASSLPEGGSTRDFRDPKIWREDGRYWAVIGNRPADGSGSVLLYESEDALRWRFVSVLASCRGRYGSMWECPDFFPLDGKHVLVVSPQEMQAEGLEFHPGNGNLCLIGTYDRANYRLVRESVQTIDYGLDFYAPQTLLTMDGRRVMIAWMQNWDTAACKPRELHFFGQMTLPRELSIREGRLCQNPIRELERYRGARIEYRRVPVRGETRLKGICGRCLDMTVTLYPGDGRETWRWFLMRLAQDGEHFTSVFYLPETGTIRVDRSHSGFPYDIVNVREFPVHEREGRLKLRVILDRYSLELFVNDGEQAASLTLYTPQEAAGIGFSSDATVYIDVEKYEIAAD